MPTNAQMTYVNEAELPGVARDKVIVSVEEDNIVSIKAAREASSTGEEGGGVQHSERV